MTLETAQKIIEENDELDLYENYSGRGMFGSKTFGVTGLRLYLERAIISAGMKVSDFRWDSMGMDTICY